MLYLRGNDMELFHFLSGGPYGLEQARIVIRENFDEIWELINVYGFAPFPPRFCEDFNMEFPAADCYENPKQMNIISRAILLDHGLVNTCRKVGYTSIVAHTNDLVVQGQFLICFSSAGTISDTYEFVYEKMKSILEIGYRITDRALAEVFYLKGVRHGDVILRVSSTLVKCSEIELSKRLMFSGISHWCNFEPVWDFILDSGRLTKGYVSSLFVEFVDLCLSMLNMVMEGETELSLIYFDTKGIMPFKRWFLIWILKRFDVSSVIVCCCFDLIVRLRVIVSIFRAIDRSDIPKGFTNDDVDLIMNTYNAYISNGVHFDETHLNFLKICDENDLLDSFFDFFLFGIFEKNDDIIPIEYDLTYFSIKINKVPLNSFDCVGLRKKWKDILSSFDVGSFFWGNYELQTRQYFIIRLSDFMLLIE
ncbi:3934_t:CDS:1 [Gigaspora rosea]|nr:3934_t:CDS:1 [Gigaspora rosea]